MIIIFGHILRIQASVGIGEATGIRVGQALGNGDVAGAKLEKMWGIV